MATTAAATTARTLSLPCLYQLRFACRRTMGFLAPSSTRLACFTTAAARPTSLRATTMPSTKTWENPGRPTLILNNLDRQTRSVSTATAVPTGGKFTYNVAASYIAKGLPYDPTTHVFHFNPYNRVQAARSKSARPESGQDAFFVSRVGEGASTGAVAVGVADGVGGWMDSGVDPADFSHAFCDYMAAAARAHPRDTRASRRDANDGQTGAPALTARKLMQKGYDAVCHDPTIKAGGSTAIVGLFGEDGMLEVANLGDSGFIHLRLNAVHAYSEPQTHAFNTPFQLSVVPPSMLLRAAAFGGAQLMDQPRDAEVTRHGLRHGDVLVFASDGLWDNLFNQDILRIVSQAMIRTGAWANTEQGVRVAKNLDSHTRTAVEPEPKAASEQVEGQETEEKPRPRQVTLQSALASQIVGTAKAASINTKLDGPFAKEVKKYYPNERWHGGKEDDICVVVVVVSEEAPPPKAKL